MYRTGASDRKAGRRMERRLRVVTRLPLTELWDDIRDYSGARCQGTVTVAEIRQALTDGPIQFVAAEIGEKLRWIEPSKNYEFWKSVSARIVVDPDAIELGSLDQVLLAWRWEVPSFGTVIVLQTIH